MQVVEILLGPEDLHPLVIEIEEALQIVELVGGARRIRIGIAKRDAVPFGQGQHVLRLERAFDVEVELGLGQAADESGKVVHA